MFINLINVLVASLSLQVASAANTNKGKDFKPIQYPGPTKPPNFLSNRYGDDYEKPLTVPAACINQDYCTIKPPDYPEEKFDDLFKDVKVSPQPNLIIDTTPNRWDSDGEDGCASEVKYDPLYQVKSETGDWRTVVQAPNHDFIQKVRLEICSDTKAKCFDVFTPLPGVTTSCTQKYSTWEVLVSTKNGKMEKVKATLPICCSCQYKMD